MNTEVLESGIFLDIAAKEGSQETAVTLCGLLVGMYFANAVNHSRVTVWVSFLLLTALHVFANFKVTDINICLTFLRLLIITRRLFGLYVYRQ